jgi:glycosyltransferase involved in cell wall biosynthesis
LESLKREQKVIFFSFLDPTYSRTSVYLKLDELSENNQEFVKVPMSFSKSAIFIKRALRSKKQEKSIFVVMSPCHILVPILRMFSNQKIILDAGWSLTEAALTRRRGIRDLPFIGKTFLIDYLAFQISNKIIVETKQQASYISKTFRVRENKIKVLFTGVNEDNFYLPPIRPPELDKNLLDKNTFVVLFRGSYTRDAGLEALAETSKMITEPKIIFIVASNRLPSEIKFRENVLVIQRTLTFEEMKYLYQLADLCVGQISNRPRLVNTIPHKAFEAAYFGKPYITSDNFGIREFLKKNSDCYYLASSSAKELAKGILEVLKNKALREKMALEIKKSYMENANQIDLQETFKEYISK